MELLMEAEKDILQLFQLPEEMYIEFQDQNRDKEEDACELQKLLEQAAIRFQI